MDRRLVSVVVVGAATVVSVGGCYRPDLDRCAVTCVVGDLCPGSLSCQPDGYCHPVGDTDMCFDAGSISDGGIDAAIDGGSPPADYKSIATGTRHTCATRLGGGVRCWGDNLDSQLGQPDALRNTGIPTDLATIETSWSRLDGGDGHTCGLSAGKVLCWGRNEAGQVGQTQVAPLTSPMQVGGASDWIDLDIGGLHSCGIRDESGLRKLYCWGGDGLDQLGDANGNSFGPTPREVAMTPNAETFTTWAEVASGRAHSCGRLTSGLTYCWGAGLSGQLGTGNFTGSDRPTAVIGGLSFSQLAAGNDVSCGIATGALYCWGENGIGQLGRPAGSDESTPMRVGSAIDWTAVSVGFSGGCGIRGAGDVYCWGAGALGELGDGEWTASSAPTKVDGLTDVTEIASGSFYSCARANDSEVWCWGLDEHGQHGTGAPASKLQPVRVGDGSDWRQIATAGDHTCGIADVDLAGPPTGRLYCWGWNRRYQLGDPNLPDSAVPVLIEPAGAAEGWVSVGVGAEHACAIRISASSERELWCWGHNILAQVGSGGSNGATLPTRIAAATAGWDDLAVGPTGNCAMVAGDRFCWGNQTSGGLGNGFAAGTQATPLNVMNETLTWTKAEHGDRFGCGIADGDVYCWGDDSEGQQGRGGSSTTSSPVATANTLVYTDVTAAWEGAHACFIDGGGRLLCWGRNNLGQLGLGNTGVVSTPTAISTPTVGWTRVSAGSDHTCGIASGSMYCWGGNRDAQIGDASVLGDSVTAPHQVDSIHTWSDVSAGRNHTCGITTSNELWCWGGNLHGVIGDGSGGHGSPVRAGP